MLLHHPTVASKLAEEHRDELRRQADVRRLAYSDLARGSSRRRAARRWWQPTPRPVVPDGRGA